MLSNDMQYDYGSNYLRQRVLLAVAQMPFESRKPGDMVTRHFSTLVPLLNDNGEPVDRENDFPSQGHVWWMLTLQTKPWATPGRLLLGVLEEARQPEGEHKAKYQVVVDSIEPVRPDEYIEVIDIPFDAVTEPRQIISPMFRISLDHPPCAFVYVRHNKMLHGPFHASSSETSSGSHEVRLQTRENKRVFSLSVEDFHKIVRKITVQVSLDQKPLYSGGTPVTCEYELIPSELLDELLPSAMPQVWRTQQEILSDVTRRLFDKRLILKRDRQSFLKLFGEFDHILLDNPDLLEDEEEETILAALRNNLSVLEAQAGQMAEALVDSGLIDEHISQALDKKVEQYVEQHSAEVRAKIEAITASERNELEKLESSRQLLGEEIAQERKRRLAETDEEVSRRLTTLKQKEQEIESISRDLDQQRKVVSENLDAMFKKLAGERESVVQEILTLGPLFQELGLFRPDRSASEYTEGTIQSSPAKQRQPVHIPSLVTKQVPDKREVVNEMDFFDRFVRYVEASGFWHRRIDLVSLHLSCKCNDITILGGQPGTGKSSLPRLYTDALMGDECQEGTRYLHVGVSPSWVDWRDLLGHVNMLEGCFQPSESGLYMHLVCAAEEERVRGPHSGMWLVCLDEMNLAQVEHYFSIFIQALERPYDGREVRCFDPQSVSEACPFLQWSTLVLPRNVRFIGTVNFDETTRQLSQRLLDRSNLIRLRPPRNAPEAAASIGGIRPKGVPVNLLSYQEWCRKKEQVSPDVAAILDQLEQPLARLGCALNPRRYRALTKFTANAPEDLCTPMKALDLQIAQRLLPRVRALFRPGAKDSIDQIERILEAQQGFDESLNTLNEIVQEGYTGTMIGDSYA